MISFDRHHIKRKNTYEDPEISIVKIENLVIPVEGAIREIDKLGKDLGMLILPETVDEKLLDHLSRINFVRYKLSNSQHIKIFEPVELDLTESTQWYFFSTSIRFLTCKYQGQVVLDPILSLPNLEKVCIKSDTDFLYDGTTITTNLVDLELHTPRIHGDKELFSNLGKCGLLEKIDVSESNSIIVSYDLVEALLKTSTSLIHVKGYTYSKPIKRNNKRKVTLVELSSKRTNRSTKDGHYF